MGAGKHCTMYWKPPTIKNYPAQSVKNVAVEKSQTLPIGCVQRGAVCYKTVWHTVAAVIDTSRSTIWKIYNYTHSQMNRKLFSGFPGTVTSSVSSRVLICKSSASDLKTMFQIYLSRVVELQPIGSWTCIVHVLYSKLFRNQVNSISDPKALLPSFIHQPTTFEHLPSAGQRWLLRHWDKLNKVPPSVEPRRM